MSQLRQHRSPRTPRPSGPEAAPEHAAPPTPPQRREKPPAATGSDPSTTTRRPRRAVPGEQDASSTSPLPIAPSSTAASSVGGVEDTPPILAERAHDNRRQTSSGTPEEAALIDRVRQRLGLTEPLTYCLVEVPVAHLEISGPVTRAMTTAARALANSMKLSGLLQPPGIVPTERASLDGADSPDGADGQQLSVLAADDAAQRYMVWFGQRRVLAAKLLAEAGLPGWERIPCHLYALPATAADTTSSKRMRALMAFSENLVRGPRWIGDLRALVELIANGVLLSDTELRRALGIEPQQFTTLRRWAALPPPILDQVFAGLISQTLLNKIALKLDMGQRAALAAHARTGELMTPDLVDRAWRNRLDGALAAPALQAALAKGWEESGAVGAPARPLAVLPPTMALASPACPRSSLPSQPGSPTAASNADQFPQPAAGDTPVIADPVVSLLSALQRALSVLRSDPRLGQALVFAEALAHELEPLAAPLPPHLSC